MEKKILERTHFDRWSCPTQNAVEAIGDKWTLFIIRELIFGRNEMRFNELLKALKPISSRTLALKLKKLEAIKIIDRKEIKGKTLNVRYKLTKKGLLLKKPLTAIAKWYSCC